MSVKYIVMLPPFQCTPTALVTRMSSHARTGSVSPNTLCVITTSTALMAQMNPPNVVSVIQEEKCRKQKKRALKKLVGKISVFT